MSRFALAGMSRRSVSSAPSDCSGRFSSAEPRALPLPQFRLSGPRDAETDLSLYLTQLQRDGIVRTRSSTFATDTAPARRWMAPT